MATIRNRNGRWHVQVRRSGSKSVNRTFTLKSDAQLWAREADMENLAYKPSCADTIGLALVRFQ